MRKLTTLAVCLLTVAGLTTAVAADDDDWKLKWSNGFKLDSPDGDFKLKFGGRLQADFTFVDQDAANEAIYGFIPDGNEFRRARVFFEGTIYEKVLFKVQYDFAGGEAEFKDVYVGFKNTPVGNVRIGHFKEPFSLEEQTSSKYITFLERSLPNTFVPGRNTGIMFHDTAAKDRLTWAIGAFRESDDFGVTDDGSQGKVNITGRVTGLPHYKDDGRQLVHLGLGVSQKDLGADEFRFRSRPEAHQSPRFVDTGSFAAEDAMLYNFEAAVVFGRFWAGFEHVQAEADNTAFGDPSFDSSYLQAGVFLTGENRRYKTSSGVFDRNTPENNFGKGAGAWEIAVRYSMIDLGDAFANDTEAGELDDISLAVNWYLNPATRLMFNYVNAEPELTGVDAGGVDYFLLRFQVDF